MQDKFIPLDSSFEPGQHQHTGKEKLPIGVLDMVTPETAMTQTYYGLSTNTKPTDATNGSSFVEMDTGKIYLYDEENADWIEWGA